MGTFSTTSASTCPASCTASSVSPTSARCAHRRRADGDPDRVSLRSIGGNDIVGTTSDVVDQEGHPCAAPATLVHRGTAHEARESFEPIEFVVRREDLVAYAEASGDHSRFIRMRTSPARSASPDVIARDVHARARRSRRARGPSEPRSWSSARSSPSPSWCLRTACPRVSARSPTRRTGSSLLHSRPPALARSCPRPGPGRSSVAERLRDHTTLRLGGPAAHWVEATTEAELIEAVRRADDSGERLLVLSGGSNPSSLTRAFPAPSSTWPRPA